MLQTSIQPVWENAAIITLSGSLTLGSSLKIFDMQMQEAIVKGGLNRLAVDMSAVPYMDSAGLGALIHFSGLVHDNGGSLRLAGVTERVASMLRMTRTDTLLLMDADVEGSLAALR